MAETLQQKVARLQKELAARNLEQAEKKKEKKKRLQTEEARYTLILHGARKRLGITNNEYCLADTIHKLSTNRSAVPGWCYAKKEYLGKVLGFSRQSVYNMIEALSKKGLIEQEPDTGYLRATDKWRLHIEVIRDKVFND